MMHTGVKRIAILSAFTFILPGLVASQGAAQEDTAEVAIAFAPAYPGSEKVWVEVLLDNKGFYVSGFQFLITVSNADLIDFTTDSLVVDTIVVPIDTCTGPEPHGDTCYVDSLIPTPVRFCAIDTAGCLTNHFDLIEIHGDTADTGSSECNWVKVLGMAPYGEPIQPYAGGWRPLFRFGVDAACLPDSISDRTSSFYITPGGNSFLSDQGGGLIPFEYHQGQVMALKGLKGDANADSLVELGDVIFIIEYLYRRGPVPCIPESADANGSCLVELGDIVHLIEYLFRGGPPPLAGCWYGKKGE